MFMRNVGSENIIERITMFSWKQQNEWCMNMQSVIGRTVRGVIDRPIGSSHPKYADMVYPVNYGYVEGVIGGDGEEQDVYVLGSDIPLESFEGRVIAVYHRFNDTEDKWIVSLDGRNYTDKEILQKIHFQEQYFEGTLLR